MTIEIITLSCTLGCRDLVVNVMIENRTKFSENKKKKN